MNSRTHPVPVIETLEDGGKEWDHLSTEQQYGAILIAYEQLTADGRGDGPGETDG